MNIYIDLHMHSIYSDDGQFTPRELIEQCYQKGLKIITLSDHNSTQGVKEALDIAKKYDITLIPAIEIDCTYNNINLHVLGYGINYMHDDFIKIENNIIEQELKCSLKKIELTNKLGFDVDKAALDKLSKNGVYIGEMFGEVLLNDPRYINHPLLLPYRKGNSRGDNPYVNFYWDYYAQGKPCDTPIKLPSLKDTIQLIKKHGGVPVIAHPGNQLKDKLYILDELIEEGIEGIEVFSNYHTKDLNEYFYNKALQYDLLITCGSDYHGKTKPSIYLGENGCTINQDIIYNQLKKRRLI